MNEPAPALPIPPGSSFALMTSPDTERHATAGVHKPVVILPLGAVEQHGPHLPLGVDCWLAEAVALAAAEGQASIRVAEPFAYGSSEHHRSFSGTMSLSPQTFIAVLVDLCTCLAEDGYLPVMLNGHGGNRAAIQVAITTLGQRGIVTAGFSYFDLIADVAAEALPDAATGTGHACALETSLMMHVLGDSVRRDLIPPGGTPPSWPDPHLYAAPAVTVWRRFEAIRGNGVIGTPSEASAEAGSRLFIAAVERSRAAILNIQSEFGQRNA
ncbi:MAG: creatininase family protein [Mesorhizobium sp.]|uniref:creatininase family protein n=1 Tax=Mesorhizobium sp. TaxID=1871066 RepID=UPI000FE5DE51|nr:creatininase family protein [Mesorhizobium sp.]RWB03085.1 MAG: creatininase family protein [Mesorhizobium sp.]RWB16945.1 MAG: creatininase family protein [Mesorhizobium sp.]